MPMRKNVLQCSSVIKIAQIRLNGPVRILARPPVVACFARITQCCYTRTDLHLIESGSICLCDARMRCWNLSGLCMCACDTEPTSWLMLFAIPINNYTIFTYICTIHPRILSIQRIQYILSRPGSRSPTFKWHILEEHTSHVCII